MKILRPGRLFHGGMRGVVYVEAVFAVVPLLFLFFGIVQLALIASARLVVRHAAAQGVRSAVVVLNDDPERFDGAPRGDLYSGGGASISQGMYTGLRKLMSLPDSEPSSSSSGPSGGGARLQAIREAVYIPLAALAPNVAQFDDSPSLAESLGGSSLARFALGAVVYNRAAAVVTVQDSGGRDVSSVGPRDPVTVSLTYLYHCSVPIASRLICSSGAELTGLTKVLGELKSYDVSSPRAALETFKRARKVRQTIASMTTEERRLMERLDQAEEPALLLPWYLTGARFLVLEATATLPNQGARYYENSKN